MKKKDERDFDEILPAYPLIVVERINRDGITRGGVLVLRREKEETAFAVVYEPGGNEDFKVGQILIINPHCGHDIDTDDGLYLTVIDPEDILAEVENTTVEEIAEIC